MTTLMLLISLALAQDYDGEFYNYKVFDEVVDHQEWVIEASNGFYLCKATIMCVGLNAPALIKAYRPAWHDPMTIYYWDNTALKSCVLKSCEPIKELTYQDL